MGQVGATADRHESVWGGGRYLAPVGISHLEFLPLRFAALLRPRPGLLAAPAPCQQRGTTEPRAGAVRRRTNRRNLTTDVKISPTIYKGKIHTST